MFSSYSPFFFSFYFSQWFIFPFFVYEGFQPVNGSLGDNLEPLFQPYLMVVFAENIALNINTQNIKGFQPQIFEKLSEFFAEICREDVAEEIFFYILFRGT